MINNLYGQDIGERAAKALGVGPDTAWTPAMTAKYLSAVQGAIAKEMGWKGMKSFGATDAEVKKFAALLNEVQGTTPRSTASSPGTAAKKSGEDPMRMHIGNKL
jgi:hypothetical protein